MVKIGFYLDDDFKSGRECRGLYYLSRAVNVGILKIPEEQLCHLPTEINAVVRFYIKEQSILVVKGPRASFQRRKQVSFPDL
jgi:hypothetical protein